MNELSQKQRFVLLFLSIPHSLEDEIRVEKWPVNVLLRGSTGSIDPLVHCVCYCQWHTPLNYTKLWQLNHENKHHCFVLVYEYKRGLEIFIFRKRTGSFVVESSNQKLIFIFWYNCFLIEIEESCFKKDYTEMNHQYWLLQFSIRKRNNTNPR